MAQTIAEKIFAAHLRDTPTPDNMVLDIDVVMCHAINTPIAIMDLMAKGMDRVFDPTKIQAVIDHVTTPKDSKNATQPKIKREWHRHLLVNNMPGPNLIVEKRWCSQYILTHRH